MPVFAIIFTPHHYTNKNFILPPQRDPALVVID